MVFFFSPQHTAALYPRAVTFAGAAEFESGADKAAKRGFCFYLFICSHGIYPYRCGHYFHSGRRRGGGQHWIQKVGIRFVFGNLSPGKPSKDHGRLVAKLRDTVVSCL